MTEPDWGRPTHCGQDVFSDSPDKSLESEVVIPAEAGIQKACVLSIDWVPAFAGMT